MKLLIGIILCVLEIAKASTDVASVFVENGVIPKYFDSPPTKFLEITYEDKPFEIMHQFTPTLLQYEPETVTWPADPNKYYTLIQFGMDWPARDNPKQSPFMMWLIVNIPGNDYNKGETLGQYCGGAPDEKAGLARFSTTIHEQKAKRDFNEPYRHSRAFFPRINWDVKAFVATHELSQPLYGNMHTARFDEYVPKAHKEWRMNKPVDTRRPQNQN